MSQAQAANTTYACSQDVKLTGHILDSLTLAKVIDRIQNVGAEFTINDIVIGQTKQDISRVSLTVMAESDTLLKQAVASIEDDGVQVLCDESATLSPYAASHALDDGALVMRTPKSVTVDGKTLAVGGGDDSLVVAVSADKTNATLKRMSELTDGELVVSGFNGVTWS